MATAYKALYQALLVAATVTTTYTVPAATSAILSTITVVNVSASASSTIKVWQTPTSGTAEADAYVLQPALTLLPGEKLVMSGPKTLATGVTIKVQAGTASVLNCLVEGGEVT